MVKRLLASKGCTHCTRARELLKERIASKEIVVIDMDNNPSASDRAIANHFQGVPTLVEEKDGQVCELDIKTMNVKGKCISKP